MALFLAHGKLVYTFNVADERLKIQSREKYNDDAWHNVSSFISSDCNLCGLIHVFSYISVDKPFVFSH